MTGLPRRLMLSCHTWWRAVRGQKGCHAAVDEAVNLLLAKRVARAEEEQRLRWPGHEVPEVLGRQRRIGRAQLSPLREARELLRERAIDAARSRLVPDAAEVGETLHLAQGLLFGVGNDAAWIAADIARRPHQG